MPLDLIQDCALDPYTRPVVKVGFGDFRLLISFNIFGLDGTSTTSLLAWANPNR